MHIHSTVQILLTLECVFSAFSVADIMLFQSVNAIHSFLTNTPMCCAWFDLCNSFQMQLQNSCRTDEKCLPKVIKICVERYSFKKGFLYVTDLYLYFTQYPFLKCSRNLIFFFFLH